MNAHTSIPVAERWKSDPLHPLSRIVSMYEQSQRIAPYSDYNPEAADEIDDLVIQIDQEAEKLSDLMWRHSAFLSDPDNS